MNVVGDGGKLMELPRSFSALLKPLTLTTSYINFSPNIKDSEENVFLEFSFPFLPNFLATRFCSRTEVNELLVVIRKGRKCFSCVGPRLRNRKTIF